MHNNWPVRSLNMSAIERVKKILYRGSDVHYSTGTKKCPGSQCGISGRIEAR